MSGEERKPLIPKSGTSRQNSYGQTSTRVTIHSGSGKMTFIKALVRNYFSSCCTVDTVKKKLPITKWLPKYR